MKRDLNWSKEKREGRRGEIKSFASSLLAIFSPGPTVTQCAKETFARNGVEEEGKIKIPNLLRAGPNNREN